MRTYRAFQVDVFTREKFAGNPAGVILNADGLTDFEMQKIARELNNSETAFVFSPHSDDHDVWVRFFTPTCEVPSCGHATVAAHFVRTLYGGGGIGHIRHKCAAGIMDIDVVASEKGTFVVRMKQAPPTFTSLDIETVRRITSALGVEVDDQDPLCPIEVVSTGHSKVLVGVKDSQVLNALSPNLDLLGKLSSETGVNGYFVFTLRPDDTEYIAEARMFAPAVGIPEDPVTGNGNGPLGAYLVKHGFSGIRDGRFSFQALQGRKIGRPGVVKGSVEIVNGEPRSVIVGEDAVVAFSFDLAI
ncbi:PhzF family phenazine biosynthesis isomerase [Terriglobus albidus]|uniref:PhzF family phenazine biosynthesis isomerase n=1 Tax=Terriglobus albidus TaxID=1592106 RepID=A0A5B9EDW7_9BACT|nr:PhzF family phenazine biosynthesis isomerase [Terriglobus albidus]QEE30212.1 PhzF family phenazine biosynthesis isomerase [Terriglobus albidus]